MPRRTSFTGVSSCVQLTTAVAQSMGHQDKSTIVEGTTLLRWVRILAEAVDGKKILAKSVGCRREVCKFANLSKKLLSIITRGHLQIIFLTLTNKQLRLVPSYLTLRLNGQDNVAGSTTLCLKEGFLRGSEVNCSTIQQRVLQFAHAWGFKAFWVKQLTATSFNKLNQPYKGQIVST